jgi:hypothetical protein
MDEDQTNAGEVPDAALPAVENSSVDSIVARLSDEYKILQDKIDKIGAFTFTIKGWSVTLVLAAFAGGSSAKNLTAATIISLGTVVVLCFFYKFDRKKVGLSRMLGRRAGRIEDVFRMIDRGRANEALSRFWVPYIAHVAALGGRPEFNPELRDKEKRRREKRAIRGEANFPYYVVLVLLSLSIPFMQRESLARHWISIKGSVAKHDVFRPAVPGKPK